MSPGWSVLVPSTLGFHAASEAAPAWTEYVDRAVAACSAVDGDLVLVGHSGARSLLR
jgi:hypothetical protein